jgi:GNAT superfamily N-acetyltransferase
MPYVRPSMQRKGIGSSLLRYCERLTDKPVLMGTWAAADWAVSFYQKHGYRLVDPAEKDRLLKTHWNIPDRQVETSVVLASAAFFKRREGTA